MQRRAFCLCLAAALVAAGCGTGAGNSAPPSKTALTPTATSISPTSQWLVYHLTAAHGGDDQGEPSFAKLTNAWTSGILDGAVYGEPLIDGGSVFVATENNSIYALDAATGAQRWRVIVGSPRTSNFPCGDIMPLGITGTPVIDGGYIYAVAEVENPADTYRFHLVKVDLSTGRDIYSSDITPSGMNSNTAQQRSALAVSNGSIVIAWGGLDGDCGSYHGYLETVSEATGRAITQWNDTPNDNEGGLWAPSGPAVDAAGNIWVATGNGSTTDLTKYDYGDSVLQFSPSLALRSFFAPGPPQQWTTLNAGDIDLGSVGPVLLSGGLLFAVGKGGRGYLLAQAHLPNTSDPGGGENISADVCGGAPAFGGMAAAGATVYVPCTDGVAAVHIDSSKSFHVLWQASSGSSSPIVAGGLIWTVDVSGGTHLVGLDPATGVVVSDLGLPASSVHFATPSAGDGRLYVAAGDRLAAFAPG